MELDGRTVLVTGGASGIGAACARVFAEHGAQIVVADLDEAGARAVTEGLAGSAHQAVRLDVSDVAAAAALLGELAGRSLDLAAVVSSAGIITRGEAWPRCRTGDLATTIAVNLIGPAVLATLAAAYPHAGPRVVVSLASVAAIRPLSLDPAYASSKAGLLHFTRSAALGAPPSVRFRVVLPGVVDTPMVRGGTTGSSWIARFRDRPLLRAEDVAAAVLDVAIDDDSPTALVVERIDGAVVRKSLEEA